MLIQGSSTAQLFWDLVSVDELPPMTTSLPDKLRSVQKHECLREEKEAGVVCHWHSSGMRTRVREQT